LIKTGIDEAGLGPILGPYCAGMVSLQYETDHMDLRLTEGSPLSAEPEEGKLAVGDSKKIYSPGKMKELEKSVLSFYEAFTGERALNARNFIRSLAGKDLSESSPWYALLEPLKLPLTSDSLQDEISASSKNLKEYFTSWGVKLFSLTLTVVPAQDFNRLLLQTPNKATVCQKILSPLMRSAVNHSDSVIVDRQGGRRYYGDWLVDLFPGRLLTAQRELKDLSRYKLEECLIDFQVKADAISFETSLASMFAKYAREICMTAFNNYWTKQHSLIKPTAGYYSDGLRFIKDLEKLNLMPSQPDTLVRRK